MRAHSNIAEALRRLAQESERAVPGSSPGMPGALPQFNTFVAQSGAHIGGSYPVATRTTAMIDQPTATTLGATEPLPYTQGHTDHDSLPSPLATSGTNSLLLTLIGATAFFCVGFFLSQMEPRQVVVAGVGLMIAGVGGSLLSMMLLYEWLGSLRYQMAMPIRMLFGSAGLIGVVCLVVAFAAVTIPREHWPV